MPKIKWNGGLEIDFKTVMAILTLVFSLGGVWYKMESDKKEIIARIITAENRMTDHITDVKSRIVQHDQLITHVQFLEQRLDACCPFGKPGGMP